MGLCSRCQCIDFNNLPPLPRHYEGSTSWRQNSGLIAFLSLRLKEAHKAGKYVNVGEFSQPLGVAHHQSIEELKIAAEECSICRLIDQAVNQHLAALAEAEQDPVYTYYRDKRNKKGPNYRFWLTKRRDDGDGFLVVSPETNNLEEVHIIAAVGFCVEDDDPLSASIAGRVIQQNPASDKTLARAIELVHECDAGHTNPTCFFGDVELPLRVVDLENSSSLNKVKLIEPQGKLGKYVALSHRWANQQRFTTTRSNLAASGEGINVEELPQTFRDAISLTRKLEIRFLWIDALCICQDDGPEWERESAKMSCIYSDAYLVLSATGAEHDDKGLFIQRSPPLYERLEFSKNGARGSVHAFLIRNDFRVAHPSSYCRLNEEPLSKRGWALQERLLASRLLHFASDQIYFECYTHCRSEDGFKMLGRLNSIHKDSRPEFLLKQVSPRPEDQVFLGPSRRYLMLQEYGDRKLTKSSDKLPALSGVARVIEEQTGDKYIAGLWRSTLLEGLLWQAIGTHRGATSTPAEYRAPSWSWAAIDGHTSTMGIGRDAGFINKGASWTQIGTVLDCHIKLKGENPYGEVTSGWVRIKAPLELLTPSEEKEPDHDTVPHKRCSRVKTKTGKPFGSYCIFDSMDDESALKLPLSALLLAYIDREKGDRTYQALIITTVEGQQDCYKRIGKILFDNETLGKCDGIDDEMKAETVTLL